MRLSMHEDKLTVACGDFVYNGNNGDAPLMECTREQKSMGRRCQN
jgi:hypothetical protein